MNKKEQRRRFKRYDVQWQAAVIFDRPTTKPTLHTKTQDISVGGTAVSSEHPDLTGATVTLLLARPAQHRGDQAKMMKLRARIVSTFQKPGGSDYRHGLSFVRAPDDGLDGLEEVLASSASVEIPPTPDITQTRQPVPVAGSRLAALKQAAQSKASEPPRPDPKQSALGAVSDALERAFRYFNELVEQLNIVNPPYPGKGYQIAGVPEFADFAWQAGNVTCRTQDTASSPKLYTQVRLDFSVANKRPMLRVVREYPASEKFRQLLKDYLIEFSANDVRNERGAVVKSTFAFPGEVKAHLIFQGNSETGKLVLKMRNVGTFGMMEYLVSPHAVTAESLEELSGFVLAESSRVGPLILRNA